MLNMCKYIAYMLNELSLYSKKSNWRHPVAYVSRIFDKETSVQCLLLIRTHIFKQNLKSKINLKMTTGVLAKVLPKAITNRKKSKQELSAEEASKVTEHFAGKSTEDIWSKYHTKRIYVKSLNNCPQDRGKSQLEIKLWINFPTTLMLLEEICACSSSQRNMS